MKSNRPLEKRGCNIESWGTPLIISEGMRKSWEEYIKMIWCSLGWSKRLQKIVNNAVVRSKPNFLTPPCQDKSIKAHVVVVAVVSIFHKEIKSLKIPALFNPRASHKQPEIVYAKCIATNHLPASYHFVCQHHQVWCYLRIPS